MEIVTELKINDVYLSKIIGDKELYKVRIRTIYERTAVVDVIDKDGESAVVRLKDIISKVQDRI